MGVIRRNLSFENIPFNHLPKAASLFPSNLELLTARISLQIVVIYLASDLKP
jgi:hypothetical protein